VPWARRAAAGALLAALRMERRFNAVVFGEYERAFASGDQFTEVAAVFAGLEVEVWLPEAPRSAVDGHMSGFGRVSCLVKGLRSC
jgi:hypothetical protein